MARCMRGFGRMASFWSERHWDLLRRWWHECVMGFVEGRSQEEKFLFKQGIHYLAAEFPLQHFS